MLRSLLTLSILALILTIFSVNVYAIQEIYAVDLSAEMGHKALKLTQERIRDRIALASDNQAGLIGFTDRVQLTLSSRKVSPHNLKKLTSASGAPSLEVGLRAAASLLRKSGYDESGLIVLYTSGSKESCRRFLQQLGHVFKQDTQVEINLYNNGEFQAPYLIKVVPDISKNVSSKISTSIRLFLAGALEVPEGAIQDDSDLTTDFGIGQIEAYELLIKICEAQNVPVPLHNAPTIMSDIVAYVEKNKGAAKTAKANNIDEGSGLLTQSDIIDTPEVNTLAKQGTDGLYVQQIYYGTNRKQTGEENPEVFFGPERAEGHPVSYGVCQVTIPAQHKRGAVESPFLGLELFADAQKHIRISAVKPMSGKDFFKDLKNSVHSKDPQDNWSNDIVVFVHGFNVTFAEGAKRTAQIAFDFGFSGAPVMFSWPSDGKLFGYTSDREDVTWSVSHIEKFIQDVRKKASPERIHLVAHSMGNQGLLGALNQISLKQRKKAQPLFESITLAAPDFDAQLFQDQIAPNVVALAKRWTIYTSDNDAALNISTKVNNAKRLGLPVTPIKGIAVVDATGVEVTPWSVPEFHSYYATKQTVIEDIVAAIKGVAPNMRELLPKSRNGIPYWQLKTVLVK